MVRPRARSHQWTSDPQAVRDVLCGLLFSLTLSLALAADLSGQTQTRDSVVVTTALAVAIVALTWSTGRYLTAQGEAGGLRTPTRRDTRSAVMPSRPRPSPYWTTWGRFILQDEQGAGARARPHPVGSLIATGAGCLLGGLLPLLPYLWPLSTPAVVLLSALLVAAALLTLGAVSARVAGLSPRDSAGQALVVGGGLAGIIYVLIVIARLTADA